MKYKIGISFEIILLSFFTWLMIPQDMDFNVPTSTVLVDSHGELLGANIAEDGQWRFPAIKNVPEKFEFAIQTFEDNYFKIHPGINPFATIRAAWQNITSRKKISGASTLTMQVIRLQRKNTRRTLLEKCIEMMLALKLDLYYSKKEILNMYSSNAPFGGNVVGLNAASWRFYGKEPWELTWSEAAALAVLPNAPSLIFPGRNSDLLNKKRNRLLNKLKDKNILTEDDLLLAQSEPLPGKPHSLPQLSNHLLNLSKQHYKGETIHSSIIASLQKNIGRIIVQHYEKLKDNHINNAAVLVIEIKTGKVISYHGNVPGKVNAGDVDIIRAPRSTGSILKPLLYAAMLEEGTILPDMLIPDIPTNIAGYQPQNFNRGYDGAVPATQALARSLNVPAVKMLQTYGVEKFYRLLKKSGFSHLKYNADHYGLSLILGGAEASLWDVCSIYAGMASSLHYKKNTLPHFAGNGEPGKTPFKKSVLYETFQAIKEVARPEHDASWKLFSSSRNIAWKTGTSFGFRDGWAIGTTPEYLVGVWVGNASGEGRPSLTGINCAAPLMFDVFNLLPRTTWFIKPKTGYININTCTQSGYQASPWCEMTKIISSPAGTQKSAVCNFHKQIHLDATQTYRVSSDCEEPQNMISKSWFVLPPSIEHYYKLHNIQYKSLPPVKPGCNVQQSKTIELLYPRHLENLYIPKELDEKKGKVIFEAASSNKGETIYWHLDDDFITETKTFHKIALNPKPGPHIITIVNSDGESVKVSFNIIEK